MSFNEEKFVRVRHYYLLAIILMFAGIIFMGTGCTDPTAPVWRCVDGYVYEYRAHVWVRVDGRAYAGYQDGPVQCLQGGKT